jgi:hypothetical protein
MKTNSANRMGDATAQSAAHSSRPLARLTEMFRRRATPSYRMAPPLRNPHYIGVHIAAVSSRSPVR